MVARALLQRARALSLLDRPDQAIAACDHVARLYQDSDEPEVRESRRPLPCTTREMPLRELNRLDEGRWRLGWSLKADSPTSMRSRFVKLVALGLGSVAFAYKELNRPERSSCRLRPADAPVRR